MDTLLKSSSVIMNMTEFHHFVKKPTIFIHQCDNATKVLPAFPVGPLSVSIHIHLAHLSHPTPIDFNASKRAQRMTRFPLAHCGHATPLLRAVVMWCFSEPLPPWKTKKRGWRRRSGEKTGNGDSEWHTIFCHAQSCKVLWGNSKYQVLQREEALELLSSQCQLETLGVAERVDPRNKKIQWQHAEHLTLSTSLNKHTSGFIHQGCFSECFLNLSSDSQHTCPTQMSLTFLTFSITSSLQLKLPQALSYTSRKQKHVCIYIYTWVFPRIGGKPPKWMVEIMETPIKIHDLGGFPPICGNTAHKKIPSPLAPC